MTSFIKNKSKKIISLLFVVLLFSLTSYAFTGDTKNIFDTGKSAQREVGYFSNGEFKIGSGHEIDYFLYGDLQRKIYDENDQAVIAYINSQEITAQKFKLTRLAQDLFAYSTGEETKTNDQIFEKILVICVIEQDCDKLDIRVTEEEGLNEFDRNYELRKQYSQQQNQDSQTVIEESGGIRVEIPAPSEDQNERVDLVEQMNEEIRELGLTFEEYRNSIGKENGRKVMLLQKHAQAIADKNNWTTEEASPKYTEYVMGLAEKAVVTKTQNFPQE